MTQKAAIGEAFGSFYPPGADAEDRLIIRAIAEEYMKFSDPLSTPTIVVLHTGALSYPFGSLFGLLQVRHSYAVQPGTAVFMREVGTMRYYHPKKP